MHSHPSRPTTPILSNVHIVATIPRKKKENEKGESGMKEGVKTAKAVNYKADLRPNQCVGTKQS